MSKLNMPKDDQIFDCSNNEEHEFIAALYGNRKTVVAAFLNHKCRDGSHSLTYLDVYELVELKLGYPLPLKRLKINKSALK